MLNNYNVVFLFLLGGLAMGLAGMVLATIIRPHKPTKEKLATYECGPDTVGTSWVQYNFRFYTYILVFLLFDVEAAYLIPWAQVVKKVTNCGLMDFITFPEVAGFFIFIEMVIFLIILIVGLMYAWYKGALNWNQEYKDVPRMTGR